MDWKELANSRNNLRSWSSLRFQGCQWGWPLMTLKLISTTTTRRCVFWSTVVAVTSVAPLFAPSFPSSLQSLLFPPRQVPKLPLMSTTKKNNDKCWKSYNLHMCKKSTWTKKNTICTCVKKSTWAEKKTRNLHMCLKKSMSKKKLHLLNENLWTALKTPQIKHVQEKKTHKWHNRKPNLLSSPRSWRRSLHSIVRLMMNLTIVTTLSWPWRWALPMAWSSVLFASFWLPGGGSDVH